MKGLWKHLKPFGPPPWWGEKMLGLHRGWRWYTLTESERKEYLEALKKHLEERLAEVNEELEKLEV